MEIFCNKFEVSSSQESRYSYVKSKQCPFDDGRLGIPKIKVKLNYFKICEF